MNEFKKRIVTIFLFIMTLLSVPNRVDGMGQPDSIKKRFIAVGIVAVAVGIGAGLLTSHLKNLDGLELIKKNCELEEEKNNLEKKTKEYRSDLIAVRRKRLNLLKDLKLPLDTEKAPEDLLYAITLRDEIKTQLSCRKSYKLENYNVKEVLELYRFDVGGQGKLTELYNLICKQKPEKDQSRKSVNTGIFDFVTNALKIKEHLANFFGNETLSFEPDSVQEELEKKQKDFSNVKEELEKRQRTFSSVKDRPENPRKSNKGFRNKSRQRKRTGENSRGWKWGRKKQK